MQPSDSRPHDVISIHAPPRGATGGLDSPPPKKSISIHAPPRGATQKLREAMCWHTKFQFTPLREGRPGSDGIYDITKGFQFTPLREGRRQIEVLFWRDTYFNSRPSARGDRQSHRAAGQPDNPISIHAPPRGATAKDMQFLQIFCSTLTNQHGLTIVPRNLSRLFW